MIFLHFIIIQNPCILSLVSVLAYWMMDNGVRAWGWRTQILSMPTVQQLNRQWIAVCVKCHCRGMHKILQEPRAEGSAHLPSSKFRCTELGLKSKHFISDKEVLPHSRHRQCAPRPMSLEEPSSLFRECEWWRRSLVESDWRGVLAWDSCQELWPVLQEWRTHEEFLSVVTF